MVNKKRAQTLLILRRRQKKRRMWVREIFLDRKQFGAYYTLFPQPKANNIKFFNYFRMD